MTEDISELEFGDKPVEFKTLVSGGKVAHKQSVTNGKITLKMIPTGVGSTGESVPTGIANLFNYPGTSGTAGVAPHVVLSNLTRKKFKLTLLWATTLPATASTLPAAGVPAQRIQIFNAYMTRYKPSYDDKGFSVEATFEWAFVQKDGTRNVIMDSTDATAQLAAVTAFS